MLLIVHTPEDVARAPKGARLITPRDFCCYVGVGFGLSIQDSAFRSQGSRPILIGCGDNAATAHDALRMGLPYVYSACAPPMVAKLQAIAQAIGAEVTADYPIGAVDMREWWAKNEAI